MGIDFAVNVLSALMIVMYAYVYIICTDDDADFNELLKKN